jgi:hypothetical protein
MRTATSMPCSISEAVGQLQVDLHCWVRVDKSLDQRHQHTLAETDRCRDAQPARELRAAALDAGFGLRHLGHEAARRFEVALALVGERQRARGAREQPRAEVAFESSDLLAHRALRRRQLAGHRREAAGLDHAHEGVHCLQTVHGVDPFDA